MRGRVLAGTQPRRRGAGRIRLLSLLGFRIRKRRLVFVACKRVKGMYQTPEDGSASNSLSSRCNGSLGQGCYAIALR